MIGSLVALYLALKAFGQAPVEPLGAPVPSGLLEFPTAVVEVPVPAEYGEIPPIAIEAPVDSAEATAEAVAGILEHYRTPQAVVSESPCYESPTRTPPPPTQPVTTVSKTITTSPTYEDIPGPYQIVPDGYATPEAAAKELITGQTIVPYEANGILYYPGKRD